VARRERERKREEKWGEREEQGEKDV